MLEQTQEHSVTVSIHTYAMNRLPREGVDNLHPWVDLKDAQLWCLGTWFTCGLGSVG